MKLKFINLWQVYKKYASYIGDFQSRLLLTLFYFILALPFGLLARLILDPLNIRKQPLASGWVKHQIGDREIEEAQRQF